MQNDSSLETAAAFVIGRIEEEAQRSGEPLDDEERLLLNHLPTAPSSSEPWVGPEDPIALPRDLRYEKLCRLTKAALRLDLDSNPEGQSKWQFAAAIFKLEGHPMGWLLEWGGLKPERPWWDNWLLYATGLLVACCGTAVMFVLDSSSAPPTWVVASSGCLALVLLYLALRTLERWQLRKTVDRLRVASQSDTCR